MFGTKDIPSSGQVLGMLCPVFQTISLILVAVGAGLPYWLKYGGKNYGIFQICTSSVTVCGFSITDLESSNSDVVTIWRVMLAFSVIGCVSLFVADILFFIYPCKKVVDHFKLGLGMAICILTIFGGALALTVVGLMIGSASVSVTDVKSVSMATTDYISWALYVCGSGGILSIVTGILFAIHLFLACYY